MNAKQEFREFLDMPQPPVAQEYMQEATAILLRVVCWGRWVGVCKVAGPKSFDQESVM